MTVFEFARRTHSNPYRSESPGEPIHERVVKCIIDFRILPEYVVQDKQSHHTLLTRLHDIHVYKDLKDTSTFPKLDTLLSGDWVSSDVVSELVKYWTKRGPVDQVRFCILDPLLSVFEFQKMIGKKNSQ